MNKKIKIGLVGFGRTGKLVADEILKDNRFELCFVIRKTKTDIGKYASNLLGYPTKFGLIHAISEVDDSFFTKHKVHVLIDFSDTKAVNYYASAAKHGIKIISAISNYEPEDLKKLLSLGKDTVIVHSPNITLGINLLLIMSRMLRQIIPNADVEIVEEHFRDKKDISGTALKIAKMLGLDISRQVNSIRAGGIVGKHEIIFGLPNQTIRLVHESINKAAFGQGAIYAVNWITDKVKGVYTMDGILLENFRLQLNKMD